MDRLHLPWLFLGPSGSGKLRTVRSWIETAHKTTLSLPLEVRQFTVGDGYEAKVLASPYHFEIDIPNLSMQDKQIIGELLTTFFSSGDVLNGLRTSTRKLVILRRAHSLSLPAAIRVRAALHQFVLPADARGMIWITAREMTGPLAVLEDAFVRHRVPRMPFSAWSAITDCPLPLRTEAAWEALEGRPERIKDLCAFFPDGHVPEGAWPRRIQDFYDDLIQIMIKEATSGKPPTLRIVSWVRSCVFQALSMCQTGPDIIDSCAAAVQRHADRLPSPSLFWNIMRALALAEPHTSYRTPLSLESGLLGLYEAIRQGTKPETVVDGGGLDSPAKKRVGAKGGRGKESPVAPAENTLTGDKPAGDKPVGEKPAGDKSGATKAVDTVVQALLSKRAPARKKPSKA